MSVTSFQTNLKRDHTSCHAGPALRIDAQEGWLSKQESLLRSRIDPFISFESDQDTVVQLVSSKCPHPLPPAEICNRASKLTSRDYEEASHGSLLSHYVSQQRKIPELQYLARPEYFLAHALGLSGVLPAGKYTKVTKTTHVVIKPENEASQHYLRSDINFGSMQTPDLIRKILRAICSLFSPRDPSSITVSECSRHQALLCGASLLGVLKYFRSGTVPGTVLRDRVLPFELRQVGILSAIERRTSGSLRENAVVERNLLLAIQNLMAAHGYASYLDVLGIKALPTENIKDELMRIVATRLAELETKHSGNTAMKKEVGFLVRAVELYISTSPPHQSRSKRTASRRPVQ